MLAFERDPGKRKVANVPMHLAQLRGAAPVLSRALLASTRLSFEGQRYDKFENVGDPPQGRTEPALIWDIVLTGEAPRYNLTYALGVYNAFDWHYSIPAGTVSRQVTLPQSGRTFLASAELSF
jgi:outer membrane receptor protein involved in Fe transport